MIRRKIYDMLLAWKKSKKQECLLVKGARQVGKSFIIRKFGQDNYSSVIEINFYEHRVGNLQANVFVCSEH